VIDFRYHVVSIVAVFLALALGLFLGSTTLQDTVLHSLNSNVNRVTRENNALTSQVHALQNQINAEARFDKALLPAAVRGRLSGQLVTVVSAPGASDSLRKQVVSAVQAAGATVSADVRLQAAFVDPKQDAFLASLTAHVTVPSDPAPASADGAGRAAGQLAAVLGQRPAVRDVSSTVMDTVLSTYSAAKLISVGHTPTTRAGTLAVVLAAAAPAPTDDPTRVSSEQGLLVDLLRDLDVTSAGAVLAAPTPAPGAAPDAIALASTDSALGHAASTVTGVETPAGQIATVFALAAQLDGVAGHFGFGPQVTPIPSVSATP
jgi:hypothetical protein